MSCYSPIVVSLCVYEREDIKVFHFSRYSLIFRKHNGFHLLNRIKMFFKTRRSITKVKKEWNNCWGIQILTLLKMKKISKHNFLPFRKFISNSLFDWICYILILILIKTLRSFYNYLAKDFLLKWFRIMVSDIRVEICMRKMI